MDKNISTSIDTPVLHDTSSGADSSRAELNNISMKPNSKAKVMWQKTYSSLGFSKAYNFPLFVIFGGAMLGFCLARLPYLNIAGEQSTSFAKSSAPGAWYYYHNGHYRVGITLHLSTALPAGILMVFQFVPIIRHKYIIIHRLNGYLVILLTILANVGGLMITRRAFGGTLPTQSAIGLLSIIITVSISMAYYNIKRLQIEQHRAWMLRTMFYMGTIITMRIIMVISAVIITNIGAYDEIQTCGQVAFIHNSTTKAEIFYPECVAADVDKKIIVPAIFSSQAETVGAALGVSFGTAVWMAIVLHLVGVEIYLSLTPRESERLRKLSYERQLEAGYKNPGSAGLTVDRWGDSDKWVPPQGTEN